MTDPKTCAPVQRELSIVRVSGRAVVARVLRELVEHAAERGYALVTRWATRLGVSPTKVRQWMDPTRPQSAIAAGDLWGLDDEDLDEVLAALCAEREARRPATRAPRDPEAEVLGIMVCVGKLAHAARVAMADGVCTPPEWTTVEHRCAEIEREVRRARAAARKAAGGDPR